MIYKDMDRKNKTYKFFLIAVFVIFTISSCVKEDDGNCGLTVRFEYTYNILSVDALKNQVDEVYLYIFGEDGILVKQYTNATTPPNYNSIRLTDLRSGNYHFVA